MNPSAFEQFERLERTHWWFRGRRRVYLELLRDALAKQPPARVLDVGAGVGGFLEPLGQLGDPLVYTELEPGALRRCVERGFPRGVISSATALPFRSQSFDLICLFDVIEHVADDQAVLDEVLRLLRPEGHVILSVPAHSWLFTDNDRVAGHLRRYNRGSLRKLFDRHGYHLSRCTYSNALLFPAIASFLLGARALESFGGSRSERRRTNLSWTLPAWLNETLYRMFSAELAISRHVDLPFGHSILVIAQKKEFQGHPVYVRPYRAPKLRSSGARVSPTAWSAAADEARVKPRIDRGPGSLLRTPTP